MVKVSNNINRVLITGRMMTTFCEKQEFFQEFRDIGDRFGMRCNIETMSHVGLDDLRRFMDISFVFRTQRQFISELWQILQFGQTVVTKCYLQNDPRNVIKLYFHLLTLSPFPLFYFSLNSKRTRVRTTIPTRPTPTVSRRPREPDSSQHEEWTLSS